MAWNKRGEEDILMVIGYIVITVFAMGALIYWISQTSEGKVVNDEALVKQVALLIDSSRAGSIIFIDEEVSISGNKVKKGFSEYDFFSRFKVSARTVDGGTEITVN